jgi:hypothetical protein
VVVGIAFGSILWVAMLIGVLFPSFGSFLIALVPRPSFVPAAILRLGMLAGAIAVPGVVGLATAWLAGSGRSPSEVIRHIARGYPLTAVMALILIFLAALAVTRKVRSIVARWADEHIAIVIKPDGYEKVAADLSEALKRAGLEVRARPAPATMSVPGRLLARVAGPSAEGLVPDRMVELEARDLRILIYPSDVMVSGSAAAVARARAAVSSRLTTTAAHLTTSKEAQAVEDRIAAVGRSGAIVDETGHSRPSLEAMAELDAIDRDLEGLLIERDDWEVLYRERLQVERDLRARRAPGLDLSTKGSESDDPARHRTARLAGGSTRTAAGADVGARPLGLDPGTGPR